MSHPTQKKPSFFAPHLALKNVLAAMDFYKKAFGAIELRRWTNDDGSVHVAEMTIEGALFHLHEETPRHQQLSPETLQGVSSLIGFFTDNVNDLVKKAIAAGAREINPVQDYEYGYRQATIADPFGHQWLIQKKI